jgi:hypothetical protein
MHCCQVDSNINVQFIVLQASENATSARGIAKMDFGESQKNLYSGVSTSDSGAGFLKSRIVVLLREASQ